MYQPERALERVRSKTVVASCQTVAHIYNASINWSSCHHILPVALLTMHISTYFLMDLYLREQTAPSSVYGSASYLKIIPRLVCAFRKGN